MADRLTKLRQSFRKCKVNQLYTA